MLPTSPIRLELAGLLFLEDIRKGGLFFFFFQVDGVEVDCGWTGEGERLLLWQTKGH